MNKKQLITGQTLVEFALILPLFIFLVMAIFEIGRAVFYISVLNTAVREGTRVAIVQPRADYIINGSNEGDRVTVQCENYESLSVANKKICTEVQNKVFNIAELSNSSIRIIHFDDHKEVPKDFFVKIEIAFDFSPISPGLNLIGSFPINVSSQMLKTPLSKP